MADVRVTYGCGCGYQTKDPELAAKHADSEGHFMHVSGTVQPEESTQIPSAKPAAARRATVKPGAHEQQTIVVGGVDLSGLRAKLARREQ